MVFLLVLTATLFRQTGVPRVHTMWAEDGPIYTGCAYAAQSPIECLFRPYSAYLQLVPRIGAQIAVLFPAEVLPATLVVLAGGFAGLAAMVVARAVFRATGSGLAGLLSSISLVLVWQAAREIGGNLTNLPWILFDASVLVLLAWWAGHEIGPIDWILLACAGLTTALAPFLPLLAIGGLAFRRPRAIATLVVTGSSAAVQLLINATSPRTPPGHQPFDLGRTLTSFRVDVVLHGPFGPEFGKLGLLVTVGIGAVVVVAIAWAALERPTTAARPGTRPGVTTIVVTIGLAVSAVGLFLVIAELQQQIIPRYTYVPAALLVGGLPLIAGRLGRDASDRPAPAAKAEIWLRRLAGAALPITAVLLTVGFVVSFRQSTRESPGPDVVAAYRAAAPTCAAPGAQAIVLPISPINAGWYVTIPCERVTGRR